MNNWPYADIHCHILPSVDDGAKNRQMAVNMIEKAYSEGIRTMILTPHFHGGHVEPDIIKVNKEYEALSAGLTRRYRDLRIFLGNEIYYYPSIPEWIETDRIHTMVDSNYVLLEFSNTVTLRELKDAIQNMTSFGYYPIIAHAERYENLVKDYKAVIDLTDMGALIQVNSKAVTGDEGTKLKKFIYGLKD